MKTQTESVQQWDDIIFEKRNKEYGAYAIRKDYQARVLKAEAISIGIGALIFIIPILMPNEIPLPTLPEPDPGIVLRHIDGKIEPKITPPAPKPPARMDASIIPTKVTSKDVPDKPEEPIKQDVTYTSGPDNGTPTTDSGADVTDGLGSNTEVVVEPPKIFTIVEKMPEYEGGDQAMMKFIQKNLHYPRGAQRRGAQGTVYVKFVVSSDGSVIDVQIEKGFDKECDAEAARVITLMNKWHAGIQNGNAVSVRKVLPLKFRLE